MAVKIFLSFLIIISLFLFDGNFFTQSLKTILTKISPQTTSAQQTNVVNLSLTPSTVSNDLGDEFSLEIKIDSNQSQVSAADLKVNFNPEYLKVLSFEQGTFLPNILQPTQISNGVANLVLGANATESKTGQGTLAIIKFQSLKSSDSKIEISLTGSQIAVLESSSDVASIENLTTVFIELARETTDFNPGGLITEAQNTNYLASFTFSPTDTSTNLGQEFKVDLFTGSNSDFANLFAAKLNFDPSFLTVTNIEEDQTLITNWASKSFDNTDGSIFLVGGVPNPGIKTDAPFKFASIYFNSKKVGTANLTFDQADSGIFRNSDNINILDTNSLVEEVITITGPISTPTPTPTSTPSPVATQAPSETPIPTSQPQTCQITEANWATDSNSISEGIMAKIIVKGIGPCSGKLVNFEVLEDDELFGTDSVGINPNEQVFDSENQAVTNWLTEFQDDGFQGINNPPEYFFNASISGQIFKSTDPKLEVLKLLTGQKLKGDANSDGNVNLMDLSMMLSSWSKNSNFIDELDNNSDGVVNSIDFSGLILILKDSGLFK